MRNKSLLAGLLAGVLLAASSARAQDVITYNVRLGTAALVGHAAGPFSLDFQFIDGDGVVNNTVSLRNFAFGGGGPVGAPLTLLGGATGDLAGGVTLPDSSGFLAEFEQGFTPGSLLSFDVLTTTNFAGATPDSLSFAILDNTGAELPTLGLSNVFLRLDLTGASPTVLTFGSDPSVAPAAGGGPIAIAAPAADVPEPGTSALLAAGLPLAAAAIRRRRRA